MLFAAELPIDGRKRVRGIAAESPGPYALLEMVAESGIRNRGDVQRLEEAGIHAMLVGEHLMRHQDIGAAVEQLLRQV